MPRVDETATLEFEKSIVAANNRNRRVECEMHDRRRLDVGCAVKKCPERLHAMGWTYRAARNRVRAQIADVPVARELNPRPAVGIVEDCQALAEQNFGFETTRRIGLLAKRHRGTHDKTGFSGDVTLGTNHALERFRREVRTKDVAARIEGACGPLRNSSGHEVSSRLSCSITARAVCGSRPSGQGAEPPVATHIGRSGRNGEPG